jgi:hypothetical protein
MPVASAASAFRRIYHKVIPLQDSIYTQVEEIVTIAVNHLEKAEEAIVSFGQAAKANRSQNTGS